MNDCTYDNAPAARRRAAASQASVLDSRGAQPESAEAPTQLAHATHATWAHRLNHSPRLAAKHEQMNKTANSEEKK